MTVLFTTDYDVSTDPTKAWQVVQEPRGLLDTERTQKRITVVSADLGPQNNTHKPMGNVLRVELRPDDLQGGLYNRAECYARFARRASVPASQWPDPVKSERWYGFTLGIPEDHVFTRNPTTWLDFAQWKGRDGGVPPLALEIKKRKFRLGGARTNAGLMPKGGIIGVAQPGTWTQFEVGVYWSTNRNLGWVHVFVNDDEALPKTSLATMDLVKRSVDPVYFKQGIYRSVSWIVPHVLFFSPTVIATSRESLRRELDSYE